MARTSLSTGRTSFLASRWAPLAVLLIGAACTAVVTRQLAAAARERDQQRFEYAARELAAAVGQRAESYRTLLRATAGMLATHNGYAAPAEFRRFLEATRPSDYPGVEVVGYARRVSQAELPAVLSEARWRIDKNYEVTPTTQPARPVYFPVMLLDPPGERTRRLLGYDLFNDPACQPAMVRAYDSGTAAASGVVAAAGPIAVPEEKGPTQPRFMIFVPVYKKDAQPADPAARQAALRGVVFGTIRAKGLFEAAFGAEPSRDAEFTIHDGPPSAAAAAAEGTPVIYRSPGFAATADRGARFTAAVPVTVAGREWTLTARSTPAFEARTEPGLVAGVSSARLAAAGGAVVTLLLGALTALQVRARAAADRAARQAATAAHRLDLTLNASGVGLWYTDLPSGRLSWDERVKALFFLGDEPAVTVEKALNRVHPDDRERVRAAVERSVRDLAPFDVEYRTVSPNGAQTNWLRSVGQPTADDAGTPVRFDVLTTDVTALKQALEQAEAARAQAERAGWVKDEFLATLSHELRTPLNAILGWAQLLRRQQGLSPSVDEGLVVIERNARVQTQLVSDLLDVSRIIAGKVRLDVQPVDLGAVAMAAVDSARPAAEAKGITVERVIPESADEGSGGGGGHAAALMVWGDAARLQQVAWNMLTNAVKFTPDGGRVRVAVAQTNGHSPRVRLTVSDTGEGIDPAFLPHLFERFSQAEAGTNRRHGGLGLGLAVVKHLVELHGGRVWAASEGPGRGSTFTVEMPAAAAGPRALGEAAAASGAGAPAEPPVPKSLVGLTVLVVDDEADARELVRRVLTEAGASVLLASGADEAFELVRARRPDVMLGDIGMPGRDGFALVRQVRELPAGEGGMTPAAALTAFAGADDGRRVLAAGYQVHVPKPAEPADLVAVVARLAGREPPADAPPDSAYPRPAGGTAHPDLSPTRRQRLGLDE